MQAVLEWETGPRPLFARLQAQRAPSAAACEPQLARYPHQVLSSHSTNSHHTMLHRAYSHTGLLCVLGCQSSPFKFRFSDVRAQNMYTPAQCIAQRTVTIRPYIPGGFRGVEWEWSLLRLPFCPSSYRRVHPTDSAHSLMHGFCDSIAGPRPGRRPRTQACSPAHISGAI